MSTTLPPGYETLEPYVAQWAIGGTANRDRRRGESTEEERAAFFNAAKDLVPAALDLLDQKPMREFSDKERRLMDLLLSFAHVALALELLGKTEPRHAQFRKAMRITRSAAGA